MPAAPTTTALAEEQQCTRTVAFYDGQACHPGGELVFVTTVLDGNTFQLEDGRTVRLLGVSVSDPGTCGGDASAGYTRSILLRTKVKIHSEPGERPTKPAGCFGTPNSL